MSQRFLAQEVIAEGVIKQNGTVSHDNHLITRGYLHGNVLNAIHPDSANYLSVVADGGVNKLKVLPLTIGSTTVDSSNGTMALFVSNVYTGSSHQEGDIVILSTASPVESWIQNGGSASTIADWNQLNTGLSDAQIRALLSGGNALTYNNTTGQFDVVQSDIRAMFSAGAGLTFSAGQFSFTGNSDLVSEGSSNLYYTDARVDARLSGGAGITYTNGVIAFNGDSDLVSEGSTNLYYTDARVDARLSGGTAITYTNGVIAFNGTTSDVAEGTNLYHTESRVKSALGVKAVSAPDVQLLTYDQTAGEYGVALSDVFAEFSAGTGIAYSNGVYSLNADTSLVSENGNLYHTTARARASVQADPATGNLLTYNNASGDMAVMLSSIRKGFANQSLTANTGLVLTHNLGERVVQVSAMDSSGNDIQLQKAYTSSTQITVTSTIALTGVDIAVSL